MEVMQFSCLFGNCPKDSAGIRKKGLRNSRAYVFLRFGGCSILRADIRRCQSISSYSLSMNTTTIAHASRNAWNSCRAGKKTYSKKSSKSFAPLSWAPKNRYFSDLLCSRISMGCEARQHTGGNQAFVRTSGCRCRCARFAPSWSAEKGTLSTSFHSCVFGYLVFSCRPSHSGAVCLMWGWTPGAFKTPKQSLCSNNLSAIVFTTSN